MRTDDWAAKAAQAINEAIGDPYMISDDDIASIIATHAAPLVAELAEQRAELIGQLSGVFQAVPVCYDTPADHYREMARRAVETRDALKHRERELLALLRKTKREHRHDDDPYGAKWERGVPRDCCGKCRHKDHATYTTYYNVGPPSVSPATYPNGECTCGASDWNARVDAFLEGKP